MYWKPPLRKRLQRNLTALAKWIVGLPYALFVTVPRVALGGSAEPPERPRRAELPSRIDVPFYTAPPEAGLARAAKAEFALLVRSQRWPELLARMRGLDRSRGTFKSGERAYRPALNGAIAAVVEPLAEPETGLRKAEAALAELETMFKAHAEDYTAAVILAHALFALAWTYRGGDAGDLAVEPSAQAEFSRLFAHAEAALDPFDPLEEDSPMLAEARYMLVAGVADGSEYMRDWYEDWADLDPVNPEMLRVHSRFLMPQWFGDYAEIEREARRAQKRAGAALGPGAYAAPSRHGLLVGATMEVGEGREGVDLEVAAGLAVQAEAAFPGLIGQAWTAAAGVRAATPDGLPLVGASASPGVILACGARRNGWLLAPLVGAMVAALALGEAPGPWAARLNPRRFAT